MGTSRPLLLLVVLLGVVPLLVGGGGLASFLLLRAGYGYLLGGVVPFLVSLLLVGVVGALLGRAASGASGRRGAGPDKSRSTEADDV